jgi:dUTP pyrophosphatase
MIFEVPAIKIGVYKMHPDVKLPKFGTDFANCFDMEYFPVSDVVHGYNEYNSVIERFVDKSTHDLVINPGERLLVPTGLIFVLPKDKTYSLRLHSRSGLALKRGLVLANGTGIVDVDYNQQVFALIANVSHLTQTISMRERICQGEIIKNLTIAFVEVAEKPGAIGDRTGGFGSTGTK